jgi:formyltetrahydrofolate deformylase
MIKAILLISCPDTKGIIAKVSNFIYENGGNIENSDQHIDSQTNTFFMRIEWSLDGFKFKKDELPQALKPLADEFKMDYDLYFSDEIPQVAIFLSKHLHCAYDLLMRYQTGQFNCKIPLIISNHQDAASIADFFKIRFMYLPINEQNKKTQEDSQIAVLEEEKIDLVVLARYMQLLSPEFVNKFARRIINIHHSFLPAFVGKNPYQQAYQRGVKVIGATSHYVTDSLDAGPIIEQATVRVSHRDSLKDLITKGQDLEKGVLGRAVKWHLERKILIYNNKTVVFD